MKIAEFVLDGVNKTYFLPSIQREFVWDKERMTHLFDSIMQQYPIGNMLAWNYNKDKALNKLDFEVYEFINDYDFDSPHNKEANLNGISNINLILDGQQRLTTLFVGLRGSYSYLHYRKKRREKLYINLFSDIENDRNNTYGLKYEFKFFEEPQEDNKVCWFEVGKVLDFRDKSAEDFKESFDEKVRRRAGENTDLIKRAKTILGELHAAFCTYDSLNVISVSTTDQEKILNVFVRANEGGVKLEKADLLLSYMESNKGLFKPMGARREILSFVDELNKEELNKPDYDFDKDDILKASLVLSDLSVQYKLINFNKENLQKISSNWENIKKYLGMTIKLMAEYGFSEKNVISKNALIPIAYYLMKKSMDNGFIDSEELQDIELKNELIKWFIISSLKGAFGSSSDSTLERARKDINASKSFVEMTKGYELSRDDINEWISSESYQSKYSHLLLMLISDVKYWGNCQQDHVFPRDKFNTSEFKKLGLNGDQSEKYLKYENSILNLQLLKPSINLIKTNEGAVDWTSRQNLEFMQGQLLPEDIDYSFSNFLTFVDKRKNLMAKKLYSVLGV